MKKYVVTIKEVHDRDVYVEADSEEEAIEKAEAGEGHKEGHTSYGFTLDTDEWDVTERI